MEKQKDPGMNILQLPKLSRHKSLIHGFSTKRAGDLHLVEHNGVKTATFWNAISTQPSRVVSFKQTHTSNVSIIESSFRGTRIVGYDGGVTREKDIILAINTADCVPVLLFEKKHQIIGAVHAGWKGIVGNIIAQTLKQLQTLGGELDHIELAIGPHIGGCCYAFSTNEASIFKNRYKTESQVYFTIDTQDYIDIGKAVYTDALANGVHTGNIEFYIGCTKCQDDMFFSYRRSKKQLDGEMVSYIGLR